MRKYGLTIDNLPSVDLKPGDDRASCGQRDSAPDDERCTNGSDPRSDTTDKGLCLTAGP